MDFSFAQSASHEAPYILRYFVLASHPPFSYTGLTRSEFLSIIINCECKTCTERNRSIVNHLEVVMVPNPTTLLEQDQQHLLHPLHHPSDHQAPLLIESGHGVWLRTVDGKEYIDGLAGLWNVLVGHGNTELAEAARKQMSDLAFCSTYIGSSNLRAIELAEKLAGFAYPHLNH